MLASTTTAVYAEHVGLFGYQLKKIFLFLQIERNKTGIPREFCHQDFHENFAVKISTDLPGSKQSIAI